MCRAGFRHLSVRPIHPKADSAQEADFRQQFPERVESAVKGEGDGAPVSEPEEPAAEEAQVQPAEEEAAPEQPI